LPITHLWYLKGVPNYLCILLKCFDEKLKVANIEQIVYFKEGERDVDFQHPLYQFIYPNKKQRKNELNKF
jgi:hypothetical protein